MNPTTYREGFLDPHFKIFKGEIGHNFFKMDDIAYPHHVTLLTDLIDYDEIHSWSSLHILRI